MANYNGLIKVDNAYTDTTLNVTSTTALDSVALQDATEYAFTPLTQNSYGVRTAGIPVVVRNNFNGFIHRTFYELFYDHLHITPTRLDLSNLISSQVRQVEVWNATFNTIQLNQINLLTLDGVNTTNTLPKTYTALQSSLINVSFGLNGSASINGSIQFVFADNGSGQYSLSNYVYVTGKRVIVFPFRHNYDAQIKESYEFLTELHQSDNGYEQLISKRLFPRHSFNQEVVLVKDDDKKINAQIIAFFKSIMIGWQDKVFCVGRWHDQQQLQNLLVAGTTSITINTIGRSYEAGSFLMFWKDEFTNEVLEIESVTDTQITLARPLNLTWQPFSTKVLPAKLSRIADSVSINVLTKTVQQPTIQWNDLETLGDASRLKTETMTVYRGFPVMMRKNNTEDDKQTYQHKIAIADSQIGVKYFDSLKKYAKGAESFLLVSTNRTELAKILYILYQLRGTYGALWIPSWEYDFDIQDTVIQPSTTTFTIKYIGYARYRFNKTASRNIMVKMKDGTTYFRNIVACTESTDGLTESIQIDTALTTGVTQVVVDNIERVSFLNLCRGLSDSFDIDWIAGDGTAQFTFEVLETNENK